MSIGDDLRGLLDPWKIVHAVRPKYRQIPEQVITPAPTPGAPPPEPVTIPARTEVFTDPADLPAALVTDGAVDLGAQLSLVQAALARFGDLQIRTVTGVTTSAPVVALTLGSGTSHDFPVTWQAPPLAPVKGAVCQIDASVVAAGRLRAVVLDDSVTDSGCTIRVTVVGTGAVTVGIALPLTVTATGLYLYWPPFQEL